MGGTGEMWINQEDKQIGPAISKNFYKNNINVQGKIFLGLMRREGGRKGIYDKKSYFSI